uniref:Prefoldin subunit 6 n=1 Tax=Parastrongyloides trichosuri TaxID=131310 RepID=A0A0N4ZFY9_PARTI
MATQSDQERIVQKFKVLREEVMVLKREYSKAVQEMRDHKKILNELKNMDPNRRSYRIAGAHLLESDVGSVCKFLEQNIVKFEALSKQLEERLESKLTEHDNYVQEHNIRVISDEEARQLQMQQLANQQKTAAGAVKAN